MKTKTIKPDIRPRFGWTSCLDDEPQIVWEGKPTAAFPTPVVVIPLPYQSAKVRAKVRAFVKDTLWPAGRAP